MDKRYYSAKHRRIRRGYSKQNEDDKSKKSFFILKLNICLGLAIFSVGAYELKDGFKEKLSSYLTLNTSVETMKETASDIKNFIIEGKSGFVFGTGGDFEPDEETVEYVKELEENSYYNIQKKAEAPNEEWELPVEGGTLTDVFGSRKNPVTGKEENHKGIDIGVPLNTEASAMKSGVVLDKGYSDSYGYWIKYRTYDNYEILYGHLSSVKAEKNQKIKQGDVIAYTGNTGNSTGPHIHCEIKEGGKYLDPYKYLEAKLENSNK